MSKFVFEVGTEELPARLLLKLMQSIREAMVVSLTQAVLDYSKLDVAVTPRRLAVQIADLATIQPRSEEVVVGPPAAVAFDAMGHVTNAAIRFAKSQNVPAKELFRFSTKKGEYVATRKVLGGLEAFDLLPSICKKVVAELPFPQRMRWGSGDFSFGRPIRWVLALLDDRIVPFEIAGVTSDNLTYGHRALGFGPWPVVSAACYQTVLRKQGQVVLDPSERRELLMSGGNTLVTLIRGRVVWNKTLLDEVCSLVEWPRPLLGDFDPSYLKLPRALLLTTMETHQKSFGVVDSDGNMLPHFLCTINFEPVNTAAETLIRKGWERVLKARLEDARFFWNTDLGCTIDQWKTQLEQVVFFASLGSMADKTQRIVNLCSWLADQLAPDLRIDLLRAAELAKIDLVSKIVGEFAELQGTMGSIYARYHGEAEAVAVAIYEHYLPVGPDSLVPATLTGALLAIADKIDTLVGCFALNMIPTSSADPYALRRATLGICRIILEHGLSIDIQTLVRQAIMGYETIGIGAQHWKLTQNEILEKLILFIAQRLRNHFLNQGYDTLIVESAIRADVTDIHRLALRLKTLATISHEPDFNQIVMIFKRAANIIRKQANSENLNCTWQPALLVTTIDQALATALNKLARNFEILWCANDFMALFKSLGQLQPTVEAFFDEVTVMCNNSDLRRNRLVLLKSFTDYLNRLADFSILAGRIKYER